MPFLELESSPAAYRADVIFDGVTLLALAAVLATTAPWTPWSSVGLVLTGYFVLALLKYLLHRFVLLRVQPFRVMHERHHAQIQSPGCCGVSHSIWDEAFGTAPALLTPAGANPRQSG